MEEETYIKAWKKDTIEMLNRNFATILYYGDDSSNAIGEFKVEDIEVNEIPEDFKDLFIDKRMQHTIVTLTKIGEDNTKIKISSKKFIEMCNKIGRINAAKLDEYSNKNSKNTNPNLKTIALDEAEADYIINGERQNDNYSLVSIDLGRVRELIREKNSTTKNQDEDRER